MSGLLIRNRKAVLIGRRLALATPGCIARCCDGCSLWRRLDLCDTSPRCDGSAPPYTSAWICASVTCEDGSPLSVSRVVLIDGLCWTVQTQTATIPPPGSYIITGTEPVQCVSGCDDPACPPPALWYRGVPCNPANPEVWFCSITQCGVYRATVGGCYRVDPATGGGTPPDGALLSYGGLQFVDCCSCESGCIVCPLMGNDVPDDPSCYPPDLASRTCCRSTRACERLVRYRGTQVRTLGGVVQVTIVNEAVNPQTQPDGSVRWQIQQTFTLPGQPPFVQILPNAVVTFGCGGCPQLPWRAPRTYLSDAFTTGSGVIGEECNGYPDGGNGISLSVSGWQNNVWSCDGMRQDVTYTYREPVASVITTRYEYETRIEDDDGGVCAGRCAGRGVSAAQQKSTGGCKGCGRSRGL